MARVTLKMIAKEAGMSVPTVSLALRGQGTLAVSSVDRIKAVAERLGYRPDPMLASLASKRFRSSKGSGGLPLALIEFPTSAGFDQPARHYREDLLREAESMGYAPTVYDKEEIGRYQDIRRLLFHRGTHGVIISGQPAPNFFDEPEKWDPFALVQCGRYQSSLPIATIRPDIFQSIQLAFNQVVSRGYQRIGFAFGAHSQLIEDDLARQGAALSLLRNYVVPKNRIDPYCGGFSDHEALLSWVRQTKPDVVISFSFAQYYMLRDADFRIPEDLGFLALHGNLADSPESSLAFLDQDRDEIAHRAVLQIDQMVRLNETGLQADARQTLIASKWVEGASLRPPISEA
jgi:LacI family transcriptional regulator